MARRSLDLSWSWWRHQNCRRYATGSGARTASLTASRAMYLERFSCCGSDDVFGFAVARRVPELFLNERDCIVYANDRRDFCLTS